MRSRSLARCLPYLPERCSELRAEFSVGGNDSCRPLEQCLCLLVLSQRQGAVGERNRDLSNPRAIGMVVRGPQGECMLQSRVRGSCVTVA